MRDFAHAVRRRGWTAWAKAHDRPRKVAQCGRCAFAHPTALFPYSAGATLPCGASACALALSFSNQTLWCCRSEEHTSELQSHLNLVCRLLLEKKKNELHTRLKQHYAA